MRSFYGLNAEAASGYLSTKKMVMSLAQTALNRDSTEWVITQRPFLN